LLCADGRGFGLLGLQSQQLAVFIGQV